MDGREKAIDFLRRLHLVEVELRKAISEKDMNSQDRSDLEGFLKVIVDEIQDLDRKLNSNS